MFKEVSTTRDLKHSKDRGSWSKNKVSSRVSVTLLAIPHTAASPFYRRNIHICHLSQRRFSEATSNRHKHPAFFCPQLHNQTLLATETSTSAVSAISMLNDLSSKSPRLHLLVLWWQPRKVESRLPVRRLNGIDTWISATFFASD